jgi:hypothetical protein
MTQHRGRAKKLCRFIASDGGALARSLAHHSRSGDTALTVSLVRPLDYSSCDKESSEDGNGDEARTVKKEQY